MDFSNARILITGVCGTIGRELLLKVIEFEPLHIIGLDNNETEIFHLSREWSDRNNLKFFCCDITDTMTLTQFMKNIDLVFHLAATKHVIGCENNPYEAIRVNIEGTRSVIAAAENSNAQKVLLTSTDKAVEPTSVMGASKLIAERMITSQSINGNKGCTYATCRFGNVVGSNGSVISVFERLLSEKKPLTLTSPEMTRFIMTPKDATTLILESIFHAKGGEIFTTKMHAINILDLANSMISLCSEKFNYNSDDIPINITGIKKGEKIFEQLMTTEEKDIAFETENFYIINGMNYKDDYNLPGNYLDLKDNSEFQSRSDKCETLSQDEILNFLTSNHVLEILK